MGLRSIVLMIRVLACGALVLLVSTVQRPAAAEVTQPKTIVPGQTIESTLRADAPKLDDGLPFGCYAVETAPGDRVSVVLSSKSFKPVIRIARGALCSAALLQHESDPAVTGSEARIDFPAAGGRYLILARAAAPGASGDYELRVEGAIAAPTESVALANKEAERRLIMEREVARREAQLAAAEAERHRRAADEARRAAEFERMLAEQQAAEDDYYEDEYYEEDYAEPQTNTMANVLNAFVGGFNSEMHKQAQMQEQFDETNRMIARQQAEERWRQESERRAQDAERAKAAEEQRWAQLQAAAERAETAARAAEAARAEQLRIAREKQAQIAVTRAPASNPSATPSSSETKAAPFGKAMTSDDDPRSCVTGPVRGPNPNCKNGNSAFVENRCDRPVDALICIWTTKGDWDCGQRDRITPGDTGSYPACFGTDRTYMSVRFSGSSRRLERPN
jgi:hypothetical protein